jgi:glycine/D-amino acid oxidase-like deaminating enzyme
MKLRQEPFWLDRLPARRRPSFPRLRTHLDVRVAVVGGGLTGAATAWSLAAARVPVVLLEAETICSGATAGSAGLIREDFESAFAAHASLHGLRAARHMWQALRRASLDFPSALRRLGIRCDAARQDLLTIGARGVDARALRREYDARRAAGVDARWLTAAALRRDAGLEAMGAIKTGATAFDPYRAGIGLMAAAVKQGAQVFERSPVARIRSRRHNVDVVTAAGSVTADVVVIAGPSSIADLRQLRRHLQPRDGYGVVTAPLAAPVRRQVGPRTSALRIQAGGEGKAEDRIPRFVRWLGEDRVLVAGGDQPSVPPQSRERAIVQRTGQLMYELSLTYPAISGTAPEWGWSFRFDETLDGIPYIGTHRNFPRHLFALGLGRNGAAAAWLAARILLRHIQGAPARGDDYFEFSRNLH